jgi:hypothetical protein
MCHAKVFIVNRAEFRAAEVIHKESLMSKSVPYLRGRTRITHCLLNLIVENQGDFYASKSILRGKIELL